MVDQDLLIGKLPSAFLIPLSLVLVWLGSEAFSLEKHANNQKAGRTQQSKGSV
jgi:hypothetical protein